jgi:hypothetical protein
MFRFYGSERHHHFNTIPDAVQWSPNNFIYCIHQLLWHPYYSQRSTDISDILQLLYISPMKIIQLLSALWCDLPVPQVVHDWTTGSFNMHNGAMYHTINIKKKRYTALPRQIKCPCLLISLIIWVYRRLVDKIQSHFWISSSQSPRIRCQALQEFISNRIHLINLGF